MKNIGRVIANRPPVVPLVINDPQISVWSFTGNLTEEDIKDRTT
jgi:hypothetical protein